MFTAWLRKVFKGVIDPVAAFLARMGISANGLTIAGCVITVSVGILLAQGYLRLGGIILLLTMGTDALDGALARHAGQATRFGAFLDSSLDRIADASLLLGLGWWYRGQKGPHEMLASIAAVGSLLVSYTRARAEAIGVECKVGLFTRVERSLILVAALVLGLTGPALWVLAIGTVATALHRILHVFLQTRGKRGHDR
ncbi:MAG: CDP-alcohol phosphatidyltransferase family protein [Chloroflexota bacterium]|nr:CDP-alcohol phosphatidyltransferase family protein [Chloroflexota bacterium]